LLLILNQNFIHLTRQHFPDTYQVRFVLFKLNFISLLTTLKVNGTYQLICIDCTATFKILVCQLNRYCVTTLKQWFTGLHNWLANSTIIALLCWSNGLL